MKTCNTCNRTKSTDEFYKRSASPDGLQFQCKACFKISNKNFREIKPEYQVDWQRTNKHKWLGYMKEYSKKHIKADDSRSSIYYIINPEQKVYVGSTQTMFNARKSAHKIQYKNRTACLPGLHSSFDMYGYDTHKWIVMDMGGTDRETLRIIESTLIEHFTKLGMSLNIRIK